MWLRCAACEARRMWLRLPGASLCPLEAVLYTGTPLSLLGTQRLLRLRDGKTFFFGGAPAASFFCGGITY